MIYATFIKKKVVILLKKGVESLSEGNYTISELKEKEGS